MEDCFLEKGAGFGKTFTSPTSRFLGGLPTLRIDYIFADPAMETLQFTRMQRKLSDHSALVTDLAKTEE
jgi:endonuclease/exonuclease/phosphatase family metal-dependent hydrolase